MSEEQPLMRVSGSVIGNNRWKPNQISIFSDRIEEVIPARNVATAMMGKHDRHVIRYEQVAAVGLHKGLKWSTLTVESTGGHTAVAKGLSKHEATEAKRLIEERLVAVRQGHGQQPPAQTLSTADELAKLGALRDSGVLDDEEFAAAKQQLLSPPPN